MIEYLKKKFLNSFTEESLKMMSEILNELKSLEIFTPSPRKILSLRKQKSFKSIKQLYNQSYDSYGEDI
jgi:hypothetical protein